MFNYKHKLFGVSLGVVLTSLVAFHGLVIFWPQENPFDTVRVNIPPGSSLTAIASLLREQKIIMNEKSFTTAVKMLGYETDIPAGVFTLVKARNNFRIIRQLVHGSPNLRKVTILEGWTIAQTAGALAEKVKIDSSRFVDYCRNPAFIRRLGVPAESSLEGFLFPETYYFFEGQDEREVIEKMVSEYRKTFTPAMRDRAEMLNLTEREIVTLASIIEGEAIYDAERPAISAVYHNRLQRGMRLQADPTIQYIIKDGPRRLLSRDLELDSPYNTYQNYGLPPGPINSPGQQSLLAALYPQDVDYLYFVARGDGYHSFSRTPEEHNRAKRKFQKVRRRVAWEKRIQEQQSRDSE